MTIARLSVRIIRSLITIGVIVLKHGLLVTALWLAKKEASVSTIKIGARR